ncbi:uracil permease [Pseudogymnoascus australis]
MAPKMRLPSGRAVLNLLSVETEEGLSRTQTMLANEDLKPVEPARRQWGPWNFIGFWIADSFNINTWMIASSSVVAGLSWWQAWICVWVGYSIAGAFVVATGRIGATYHIGFPVASRASFGIWGGQCVTLMITSIWPQYEHLPNSMPASSGTTTKDFLSFFLFSLCSLPALYPHVHKIRHLFTVKSFVVPVAGIAFFIWGIVRAKGLGPVVKAPNTIHGSELAWAIIKGIMSSIANFSALIINVPDFSRFAIKPKDAFWSQLFTIPIGFGVTSFIGIIVSSCSVVIFGGEAIWNPLDLLDSFLKEGGSGNRAGVFFIAASFTLAQLGTNIAANSISAGTDLTALLPRYLTIRRGGYICAAVGFAMCPWNLLSSSNNFTTYLSAYSVFLSSIAGVMLCDYYVVRKGYLQIRDLYTAKKTAPYYFTYGFNWRAYAAYIAGILINIVGFVGAVREPTGGPSAPLGAQYLYNLNYFCGFIVAGIVYYGLCRISPIPAVSDTWLEVGDLIDNPHLADSSDSDGDEKAGAKMYEDEMRRGTSEEIV